MIDWEFWINTAIVLTFTIIPTAAVYKLILQPFWKDKIKHENQRKKESDNPTNDIMKEIEDMIDNAPRIKNEVDAEIEKLKKNGVTDAQMGSLLFKKQLLDWAVMNPQLTKLIGKPLAKTGLKLMNKLPKYLEGLVDI